MQPSIDQNKCQSKELFVESERCAVVLRKDVVNVSGKGVFILADCDLLANNFWSTSRLCQANSTPSRDCHLAETDKFLLICLKFSDVLLGAPVSVVLRLKLFS